jgi:hypothetical protein
VPLLAFATLLLTRSAGADAPPHVTINVESDVPAGGVIAGSTLCSPNCDAPTPEFFAEDGTPIPGMFSDKASSFGAGHFVFIPDPPLGPGTYTASATGLLNTSTVPFTIVEATLELPTFTHDVTTGVIGEGDPIQCQELGGDSLSNWFTTKTRVRPVVTVYLVGPHVEQYHYALGLPGEAPTFVGLQQLQGWFNVTTDELCFEVTGFSYQDDTTTVIGEACVSLVGLGVGVVDEMSGDFDQTLLGCVVPPEGYQDDWCELFDPAFTAQSCDGFDLDSCFAARRACPGGDQPSAAEEQEERAAREAIVGTGGMPGAGGGNGTGGQGVVSGSGATVGTGSTPGAGGMPNGADPSASSAAGGCSLGAVRPVGPAQWPALLLLLLVSRSALSRRRL